MKKTTRTKLARYLELKYPVKVVECEEGGCCAMIPDLPGCLSQGDTAAEAMKNIQEAKELWLESAVESGCEIPLPSDETKRPKAVRKTSRRRRSAKTAR